MIPPGWEEGKEGTNSVGLVLPAVEGGVAVETSEVCTLASAFVGVEFGLFDGVVTDFAGDYLLLA